MITLYSSNTYTPEDFDFLLSVLDGGYKPCECDTCNTCTHRIACGDTMRLYRYVLDKRDRESGRRGKRQAD